MAERTPPHPRATGCGALAALRRGWLEAASGRNERAWVAFQSAQRLAKLLRTPAASPSEAFLLQVAVRLNNAARIEAALADLDEIRDTGEAHIALATLDLAKQDYKAARDAVAPVLDGSAQLAGAPEGWLIQALLLDAIACRGLGDADAAAGALERALGLAEPDRVLLPFLLHPSTELLKSARPTSSYASLISEILTLLGHGPNTQATRTSQAPLPQRLSDSELRILRYLPTGLSTPEIARELYLSKNTVKTHISHLYDKLGVHRRWEAVERGRALGLVASSSRPS